MTDDIVFTDRYEALGIPYPDAATVCEGQCEGVGRVPIHESEDEDVWKALWNAAHAAAGEHECDGFHFVVCPDCGGTGKRAPGTQPEDDAT